MHDYELDKVQGGKEAKLAAKTIFKTIIETTKQRRKTRQFIRGVIVLKNAAVPNDELATL